MAPQTHILTEHRATLAQHHILRDDAAIVGSEPCPDALRRAALPVTASGTCELVVVQSLGIVYRVMRLSRGHSRAVVLHEGHGVCDDRAPSVISDMSALIVRVLEHADVVYADLPLCGLNRGQQLSIGGYELQVKRHDWFALTDFPAQSGLAYFLSHLRPVISEALSRYESVDMVGRSGGGWATTVYAATDPRVRISISVAGTVPLALRSPQIDGRDDLGDWEQYGAFIYRLLGYEDLYALAGWPASTRRHVQIFNEFDTCCFGGEKALQTEAVYKDRYGSEGDVTFLLNRGEMSHDIPLDLVIAQLFGDDRN